MCDFFFFILFSGFEEWAVFIAGELLVLTSFCQQKPEEISCVSVSCFSVEPGPSPSQSQLWSKPRGCETRGGLEKGVEVI